MSPSPAPRDAEVQACGAAVRGLEARSYVCRTMYALHLGQKPA